MNYKGDRKIFQKLFLLLVGALLVGCAGKVEPEIRTVRVEVPVQVPWLCRRGLLLACISRTAWR